MVVAAIELGDYVSLSLWWWMMMENKIRIALHCSATTFAPI